jgi:riboflavin synthase
MFTGLIECMGVIRTIDHRGSSAVIGIEPDRNDFSVKPGGSVAIDGVCLTLEKQSGRTFLFSAVRETLQRTTFNGAAAGKKVNLERALCLGDRLDGHLVAGHVDGLGVITKDKEVGGSLLRTISVPDELTPLMAEKGSVAVDGVSLTIASCGITEITISFIPVTLAGTTMSLKKSGDKVNLECDMIARYLHKIVHGVQACRIKREETLLSGLERLGF